MSEGASAATHTSGTTLARRYELIRPVGEGGLSVVWVAHDTVLDVDVAVKIISVQNDQMRAQLVERTLQEARTAAQLMHPAICAVQDVGVTDAGDPFLVSELMHGASLAELYDSVEHLSPLRAIQLLLPIIDALSSAHARGIVHRDVKPENIFLARDTEGRLHPKLLDFGIARFMQAKSRLTLDGTLLGTPDYMSPEQARGQRDTDLRTDVWSMCVVLYEAMTGRVPFEDESYTAVLSAVLSQPIEPILRFGVGDDALWAILARGLSRDPADRWPSMRDLGRALADWLNAHGVFEDAGGTSLRSQWLEAPTDSERPPPPDSLEPTVQSHRAERRSHITPIAPPPSMRDDTLEGKVKTQDRSGRRRSVSAVVVAVLAAGAVAAGVGFGLQSNEADPASSAGLTSPAAPAAASYMEAQARIEASAPVHVAAAPVTAEPQPAAEPAASARSPQPEPTASARPATVTGRTARPTTAPRPPQTKPKQTRRASSEHDYVLGF